jgi:hypothetical protein
VSAAYLKFLASKVPTAQNYGFEIEQAEISPILKQHQRDIVQWAVQGGRRAIFAAFGIGKSVMQLEIERLILERTGGAGLIVCPLGVRQEFIGDALELLNLHPRFIRRSEEFNGPGMYLTNYESIREGLLDPNLFDVASLDEASILRSYGSKTYQTFLPMFDDVKYRFVATATPSPNRYKELIHYAGFLGIMDTGQALTRFFQRDSTKANQLTLYPHKAREFWLWLNTWACFIQRPSDLGYSDEGYDLPEIEVLFHEVEAAHEHVDFDRDGQGRLVRGSAPGVSDVAREKRSTLDVRIAKVAELVNEAPEDHFVIWHDLEDERRAIKQALPEAAEVYGTLDLETREQRIADFSDGKIRLLATKPRLSGSGCNFQRHCHREIFAGVGFKFNDFIQAVHRTHRYLQQHPVRIDIVHSEAEREVVRVLMQKWARHKELTEKMSTIIREHGLNQASINDALVRSMGVERVEVSGEGWLAANNDCVLETAGMETDSVDEIVSSIPFADHYEYTPSYNDFGHTDGNGHFFAQMDFLTPELFRVLKPGRLACIHVKDRVRFGNVTGLGAPTMDTFHEETVMHFLKHGFVKHGMITVVTDVVRENNQTYRLSYGEMLKDGTKMGVGCSEYILLFRKPQTDRGKGYADTPVTRTRDDYSLSRWQVDAHAFWRSSGNRLLTPEELATLPPDQRGRIFTEQSLTEVYDYEAHVQTGELLDDKGALPKTFMNLAPASWKDDVWHDVNRMLTLNTQQSRKAQAMHVCPLQFDIVDRLIVRYSNPGELIYDPFGGLMTVPMRALHLGRRGRGVELNPEYFRDGVKYLQAKERELDMPSLFDLDEVAV